MSVRRIVCVDNSCDISQFKQLKLLQNKIKNSRLLVQANSENKGFGAAINTVVNEQFTRDESLTKVLLINPDVELKFDSLDQLIHGATHFADAGIWGGVTVDSSEQADGFHAWREPTLLREIAWAMSLSKMFPFKVFVSDYRQKHKDNEHTDNYSVDAVSGCFLLIDRHLWQGLNGFDERFFLYSEEIDLCHRARSKGANPQVITGVKFTHARGTSNHDLSRMKMLVNSKLLYWEKHHGAVKRYFVQIIYVLAYSVRGLVFGLFPARRKQAKNMLLLSRDLLFNRRLNTA